MNKTARDMFEKLGYEYSYGDDNYLSYFINKPNEKGANFYEIRFWLEDKDYTIENNELLTIDLFQAINKQIEELWGDDILKNNRNK